MNKYLLIFLVILVPFTIAFTQDYATFTVRIENVSTDSTLRPSDGSKQLVPLSPGVWAVHDANEPLFTAGQPDRGDGLEAISEDGSPGMLSDSLRGQAGILRSALFNTPAGAGAPGPLVPGGA